MKKRQFKKTMRKFDLEFGKVFIKPRDFKYGGEVIGEVDCIDIVLEDIVAGMYRRAEEIRKKPV